jgi:cytosine/adenosine deaminase-related metal-dependent hydrolase
VILANATIVTMDPERRIITDGAVAVAGSTIVSVGKVADVLAAYPADQVRDQRGGLLMPGLIDGHVHLPQAMLRGCADEIPLWRWMTERVFVLEGAYTPADMRASTRLAILEMLKAGTTTFAETLILGRHDLPALARTIEETGIRAILPRGISDGGGYLDEAPLSAGISEDPDDAIAEALEVARAWQGSERIRIWFGPRSTGGTGEALLRRLVELGRSEGLGLIQHYAMTTRERRYIRERFGCGQTAFLERIGMIGPDVVLLHACALDADDIAGLSGTGTSVVHCPTGPAKMGSGVTPVADLLDAGVNVALGTDANAANNGADLLRDLKWVAYLQKLAKSDPTVVTREQVLEAATIAGARALGLDAIIGSIEVGKRADLIVLRTDAPHWTPTLNIVSNIVYSSSGADVDTVMIDGRIVMEGRRMLTLDEDEVLGEARERSAALVESTGVEIPSAWPIH